MEKITNLRKISSEYLKEIDLILQEQNPKELFDKIDKILRLLKNEDKTEFSKIDNFDMFIVFINSVNSDKYSYYETLDKCKKIKSQIRDWTYKKVSFKFEQIIQKDETISEEKRLDILKELGLLDLKEYDLNIPLFMMDRFLAFKDKIQKLEISSLPMLTNSKLLTYKEKIERHKQITNNTEIEKILGVIKNYKESNEKKLLERKKIVQTTKPFIIELIKMIDDGRINEIESIDSKWMEYIPIPILDELLKIVIDNQYKHYKQLSEKEENLNNKINKTPLIKFLYDKKIDPDTLDPIILKKLEKEDITKIESNLELLLMIGFNIEDIITKYENYLIKITPEIREKIKFLLSNQIITKTLIINNIDLLYENFNKLLNNYTFLKTIIDFKDITYNDKILLLDEQTLKERIEILKLYNLSKPNFIYLLNNYKYLYLYDLIIENDISPNLFIAICNTRDPLKTIKRIIICKTLNIPYKLNEYTIKKDVKEETKFICYDTDLDMYIDDVSKFYITNPINGTSIGDIEQNELVKYLDENYQVDQLYLLENTQISRSKVLRNLEYIKQNNLNANNYLLSIFGSNSILSEKNIYEIRKTLEQKKPTM